MPKWTKQQWAKWNANWNQQHSSVPNDANLGFAGIKGLVSQFAKSQRAMENHLKALGSKLGSTVTADSTAQAGKGKASGEVAWVCSACGYEHNNAKCPTCRNVITS